MKFFFGRIIEKKTKKMIKIILEYCFNVSSNLGQWKRANLMKFIFFLFFFVAKLKLKKLTKKKYKLIKPQK